MLDLYTREREEMTRRYFYKDVLPFTAMVAVECGNVGVNVLFKAATSKGMSYYIFITYCYAIATLILLPLPFIFYRFDHNHLVSMFMLSQIPFKICTNYVFVLLLMYAVEQCFLHWSSILSLEYAFLALLGIEVKLATIVFLFICDILICSCFLVIEKYVEDSYHKNQDCLSSGDRFSAQICTYRGIEYSSPTLASAVSNLSPAFTFMLAVLFRFSSFFDLLSTDFSISVQFYLAWKYSFTPMKFNFIQPCNGKYKNHSNYQLKCSCSFVFAFLNLFIRPQMNSSYSTMWRKGGS